MKNALLSLTLLIAITSSALGQVASRETADCRKLIGSVRPPSEDDERATRYLTDADRAYRDCRGSALPVDVRVNTLLMYGIASDIRGRAQAAIAAYHEALDLLKNAKGADANALIEVLDQVTSVESRAGIRADATVHSKRALEERVKRYGPTSTEVSLGMVNLGMVYATFGEYEQSEKLLRKAVRVAEKACGPECDALVLAYSGMQALYDAQGNKTEAQKYADLAQDAVPPRLSSPKQ